MLIEIEMAILRIGKSKVRPFTSKAKAEKFKKLAESKGFKTKTFKQQGIYFVKEKR